MEEALSEREQIEAAERAFECGDYRRARALAAPLSQARDRDIARKAHSLVRKVQPDAIQIVVLAVATLLFLYVTFHYVLD